MIIAVSSLLFALLLLLAPALLAGRRFGMARAFGALGVSVILSGVAGLMSPYWDIQTVITGLVLSLLAWSGWIQFAPTSWSSFMAALMGSTIGSSIVIALLSTVVPLGNLEWLARFTTNAGLVEYYSPLKTRTMNGDWRDQHIIDGIRIADPVLFWRSRPGAYPINSQGFKTGTETRTPKPKNVFRIMSYGDSNTEGTNDLDWSNELHQLLQSRNTPTRTYEVVNAGVSGYSSYQGVQRFLQEWERYEPDLIFVSYGWNDISKGMGQPDKSFTAKSPVMARIIRALLQYRFYLVIQHYAVTSKIPEKRKIAPLRVSPEDYLDNMTRFAEVGKEQGFEVVFLTRPYRNTTAQMINQKSWRSRVPKYNEALSEFAAARGAHLIDVQQYFESETQGLFMDETHFSEEGMAEMARFLARELDRLGLLEAR